MKNHHLVVLLEDMQGKLQVLTETVSIANMIAPFRETCLYGVGMPAGA